MVCLYLGTILVLPLMALPGQVAAAGLAPTLATFADPAARHGLWLTLVVALIAVVANGIGGVGGALVLSRHRFPGRRLLDAL